MSFTSNHRWYFLFSHVLIPASLLMGCTPQTETGKSLPTEQPPKSFAANVVDEEQASEKAQPTDNNVVITGDLNSVDWNSHIGKQVMIEGNLMIVDTYDLARRGQIKVARNRLHVPTSRIDPNDADAKKNSFKVIKELMALQELEIILVL